METKPQYWTPEERELIQAVVANDVEEVKIRIEKLQDRRILDDIGWVHIPFPLHYITLCLDIIWGTPDQWGDVEHDVVLRRSQIDAMLAFWREYYGVSSFQKIDYSLHKDYYYDRADETDADILWAEPAEFVAAGYDIKDVELYCAAVRFDFERVRQLLEDGAKPNVNLLPPGEQEYRNTLYSISIEEAHLSTEIDIWGKHPFKERDIRLLLALTAHSEMYDLLNKYCKK